LIKRITSAVDDKNKTFKERVGSRYTLKGQGENIVDTLEQLPDEL
jgi:hypothetical protein